jgi:hypothetical protein
LQTTRERVTLDLPTDLVAAHSSVIGYVQENNTLRILGAAAVDLVSDSALAMNRPEISGT